MGRNHRSLRTPLNFAAVLLLGHEFFGRAVAFGLFAEQPILELTAFADGAVQLAVTDGFVVAMTLLVFTLPLPRTPESQLCF